MAYYDRQGNSISMEQWGDLRKDKVVEQTRVVSQMVSTVWLGMDHNYRMDDSPPLIFETMVFHIKEDGEWDFSSDYCERYSTEEEAMAGHLRAVEEFQGRT